MGNKLSNWFNVDVWMDDLDWPFYRCNQIGTNNGKWHIYVSLKWTHTQTHENWIFVSSLLKWTEMSILI